MPSSQPNSVAVPSDVTQCPVCCELLVEPRQLPDCLHVYCLRCVSEFAGNRRHEGINDDDDGEEEEKTAACPLCGVAFEVPDNGPAGLPRSAFIEKLIEVRKLKKALESGESGAGCELCTDPDEQNTGSDDVTAKKAAHYCTDCAQRMCEQCATMHRRMKATTGHQLIALGAGASSSSGAAAAAAAEAVEKQLHASMSAVTSCSVHPSEYLKVYCNDCTVAICTMCHIGFHNGHDCSDINRVADQLRRRMRDDVRQLNAQISLCRSEATGLERAKGDFTRNVLKIQMQITETSERLKRLVDDHRKRLLVEVAGVADSRRNDTDQVESSVERHLSALETFCRYSDELADIGSPCDVAEAAASLARRADTLRLFDVTKHVTDNFRPIGITFVASSPSDKANVVGSVSVVREDDRNAIVVPPPAPLRAQPVDSQPPKPAVRQSAATSVVHSPSINRTQPQPPPPPPQPVLVNLQRPLPQTPETAASLRVSQVVGTPVVSPRSIHVEQEELSVENTTVASTSTLVLSTPPVGRPVLGVAACSEEVYVTRHATPEIEVYETTGLTLKRRIPVPGLGSWPYGLAVGTGYLFVSDFVNNAIHRLEIVGLSTLTTRWAVSGGPAGLSVIAEGEDVGNVVVVCSTSLKIQVYSASQGTLIYELRLRSDQTPGPSHAVRLIGGQFILSHSTGANSTQSPLHRICMIEKADPIATDPVGEATSAAAVAKDGQPLSKPSQHRKLLPAVLRPKKHQPTPTISSPIESTGTGIGVVAPGSPRSFDARVVLSYGAEPGCDGDHLSVPRGVAIDGVGRALFVADRGNDRIVVIDRAFSVRGRPLEFTVGADIDDGRIHAPRSVHFDEQRGRLYVGEEIDGGRVIAIDNVTYGCPSTGLD